MRILHVTPSYLPARRYGGTIYATHGLCKSLAELGHDVHVYATNRDGEELSDVPTMQPTRVDGVTVTYFPVNFPKRLYHSHSMAGYLKNRIGVFDIVHGHSLYLWPPWYTSRVCAKCRVPYVLSAHGMLVYSLMVKKNRLIKTLWIKLLERNNFRRASALHFASSMELKEARRFKFHIPRHFITAHGVAMPAPAAVLPGELAAIVNNRRYILYVGRLNWKKGIENLIRAMTDVDDAQLIIAGNDEENYRPRLHALIDTVGLQHKVTICGPVWDENKAKLMQEASVFVLPSYSENFGIAALEAMSVGCPVVVTSGTGVAEIVSQHRAGVVTTGDSASLARAIDSVLADREQAARFGAHGRRAVAEYYDWKRIGRLTLDNYQQVIDRYRP